MQGFTSLQGLKKTKYINKEGGLRPPSLLMYFVFFNPCKEVNTSSVLFSC